MAKVISSPHAHQQPWAGDRFLLVGPLPLTFTQCFSGDTYVRYLMPSLDASLQTIRMVAAEAAASLKAAAGRTGKAILRPKRLEAKAEGVTRTEQWVSFFFLLMVLPANFAIIVAFNEVASAVFGASDYGDGDPNMGVIGFLITFLTLGAVVISAWAWFQFVRTSGFGLLRWDES